MKIQAQTVAHSKSPQGGTIWSGLLTFPKYLLAEAKTHRIVSQDSNEIEISLDISFNAAKELSRNSASSRAIPTKKLLKQVSDNPFIPIAWQKEHKGMQGTEYWTDEEFGVETKMKVSEALTRLWLQSRDSAYEKVHIMQGLGATKQMANRLLEPFLWTTVLVTGTEWDNFFELRCPQYTINEYSIYDEKLGSEVFRSRKDIINKYGDRIYIHENDTPDRFKRGAWIENFDRETDWLHINKGLAEIHMMALAEAIWDAQQESKPKQLQAGEWHIPFEDRLNLSEVNSIVGHRMDGSEASDEEYARQCILERVKIATAMAARTSYTVVGDEKEVSYETLIGIHDKMANQVPFHASPFEHCARAMNDEEYENNIKGVVDSVMEEGLQHEMRAVASSGKTPICGATYDKNLGWCRNFRGFIQYRHILEEMADKT